MLKKKNRIHLKKDFDRIFKNGYSFYCPELGLKFIDNDLSYLRAAVIVSNKVSKSAVVRNKIKRIIKSYLQERLKNDLLSGKNKDVVIIVLPEALQLETAEFKKKLDYLFEKVKF